MMSLRKSNIKNMNFCELEIIKKNHELNHRDRYRDPLRVIIMELF